MAEGKYEKYFIKYGITTPKVEDGRPILARVDDAVAKGSNFYLVHWVAPGFGDNLGDYPYAGHPPHIHKTAELLMHIGGNPDDPMDLGAEVEMHMGPELERHTFTESTVIYIPPNFIHSPWRPLKVDRPFLFIEVNQGPEHTEKFYPQLLPKEARDKIDWSRWPDKGF